MTPVELAVALEAAAKELLAEAQGNPGDIVPGLYETKGRVEKAFFDLETALAVNSLRRQSAGLRTAPPSSRARAIRRAKTLLGEPADG